MLIPAFAISLLIFSCATQHPNQKMIIGNWSAQKVAPYTDPNAPAVAPATASTPAQTARKITSAQDTSKMRRGEKGQTRTPEEIAAHRDQRFKQILRSEERSQLKIYPDKTAEKSFSGKMVKGKWKMNKAGNRLTAKSKGHGKSVMDILYLNDSVLIAVEHFPIGDVQVKYVKTK